MNYLFKPLCLLLLMSGAACSSRKSVSTFTQFQPLLGDSAVSGLQIGIQIDTVQKTDANGLRFSVQLTNKSPRDLIVNEISESLSAGLLNSSGFNVLYPSIRPSLINATTEYVSPSSLKVIEIRINGSEVKPEKKIPIPGNGHCEVKIAILKVLPPGAEKPYDPDKLVPLASGKYTLVASFGIIQVSTGSVYTMKPVAIRYGK